MDRQIERRRGLPGSRAVVGGLLMAVAAVGVFAAWSGATERPTHPVVIASGDIRVGEPIEATDLRVVRVDLPAGLRAHAFAAAGDVEGRIALGPIAQGELVQSGLVTDDVGLAGLHEVAVTLPREQIAVGRLKQGERVDVFVTYEEATRSVVRGAEVVQIDAAGDGSLTSDREIELVIAVPSGEDVAAVVHALRTGDVTVVRSTFGAVSGDDPIVFTGDDAPGTAATEDEGEAD